MSDYSFRHLALYYVALLILMTGLPLLGILVAGKDIAPYLQFPPQTRYVSHAGFSWPVFALYMAINAVMLAGIGWLLVSGRKNVSARRTSGRRSWPWWGWLGLAVTLAGWVLAWTRFPWFAGFQRHTFVLPWIGYILTVNAICQLRAGTSLLTDSPMRFALLFPASALFWWFFEYLNRFVQNWYYVGVQGFSPLQYTLFASLSFATVLPAVLGTYRLLLTFRAFSALTDLYSVTVRRPKLAAMAVVAVSTVALALMGVLPDILFSLVWVAPLLLLVSLQALAGRRTIFHSLPQGDWRPVITAATAALVCGFFWEMWNVGSAARWVYTVPYVDRFHIFAMPLPGYGGYLPFGLECLAIGHLIVGPYALHLPDRQHR